jgi:hypothetical protein
VEGLSFVREAHLSIAEGCYLPRAALFGHIQDRLHELIFQHPELKAYIPNLQEVDLFASWDEDNFLLLISPERRAHLPARGMETNHLKTQRESGRDIFRGLTGFLDISDSESVSKSFAQLGIAPGFAAIGRYPAGTYTPEAKAEQAVAAQAVVALIHGWAKNRMRQMENSRIFLSHKGINKPLVEHIDGVLRMLNLKTWFDRDDLNAGDTLVRGVDEAFSQCAAAIFFISKEYIDAGVIRKEIDRALHEAATRPESFRIIPLVLRQHGGSDEHVPAPLRTLVWKTVDDIQIVPTILKALPTLVRAQIAYAAPKH